MEIRRRLIIFAFAALLFIRLLHEGHGTTPPGDPVAFVHSSADSVVVRVGGNMGVAGVYHLPRGSYVRDVIKMTEVRYGMATKNEPLLGHPLRNGDVVEVTRRNGQDIEIKVLRMTARELMLLHIPLIPDAMTVTDWEALPGIGAALAQAIVTDRQANGDFGGLEGVKRVSGMGEKKLKQVEQFFR